MRILGKVREENNEQLFDKAFIVYTFKNRGIKNMRAYITT